MPNLRRSVRSFSLTNNVEAVGDTKPVDPTLEAVRLALTVNRLLTQPRAVDVVIAEGTDYFGAKDLIEAATELRDLSAALLQNLQKDAGTVGGKPAKDLRAIDQVAFVDLGAIENISQI